MSRSYSVSHSLSGRSDMSETEADRKRNKLGYQRISIACSHCRRRKIRCTLADGDPEQRCTNCIRLKKECVFYPVDQQGPVDNRSTGPTKTAPGVAAGGPTSPRGVSISPVSTSARTYEAPEAASVSSARQPSSSNFHGLPIEPGRSIPIHGGYADTEYDYRPGPDAYLPRYNPQTSFSATSHSPGHPPDPHTYWRSNDATAWQHHAVQAPMQTQRSLSYADTSVMTSPGFTYGAPLQQASGLQGMPLRYPEASSELHVGPLSSVGTGLRGIPVTTPHMMAGTAGAYMIEQPNSTVAGGSTYSTQTAYANPWYGRGHPSMGPSPYADR